jgi:hypothetical protein
MTAEQGSGSPKNSFAGPPLAIDWIAHSFNDITLVISCQRQWDDLTPHGFVQHVAAIVRKATDGERLILVGLPRVDCHTWI